MKKNIFKYIFVILGLTVCIIPSFCMIFSPSDEPIGNERETSLPEITTKDEKINTQYLTELGAYFEKHIAFRPYLITADALIQSKVFASSNVSSVITGKNDFLYYTSTLDDYTGRDPLSDRDIRGIVKNLDLIRSYCKGHGVRFLFTSPPNKNSLYPENMPYYAGFIASDEKNIDRFREKVGESEINYCDLFPLFEESEEVLYLERDSHWTNEGALMAYNKILDSLSKEHDDHSLDQTVKRKDFYGDLSKMIYPSLLYPEFNIYYDTESKYTYVNEVDSVEDTHILTQSDNTGSLYMYRDSFGNALIPFFASAYGNACFSKSLPSDLRQQFSDNAADTYIIEIVERNIDHLIKNPPLFPFEKVDGVQVQENEELSVSTDVRTSVYSSKYMQISGDIQKDDIQQNDEIYVKITDQNEDCVFDTYYILKDSENVSFLTYIPYDECSYNEGDNINVSIIIKRDGKYIQIADIETVVGGILI